MPLLDSLKPVVAQWTARYRRSPVPAFLSWWKAELIGCLPASWQAWFQDRRETWFAIVDKDELRFQKEGQVEPFARFDLAQQPDIVRADVQRLLGNGPSPERRLLLAAPSSAVLRRQLQFPVAVEQNLRQVLSFEMDRQTPFKADQVHFDYQAQPLPGGKQLRVDMVLTPKPTLDALVERSRALALPLDGIDVPREGQAPQRQGFNLLPESLRARQRDPQKRLNLILAASALLLLVMVMHQSVANRAQALEGLRAQVEEARTEARAVVALRNQLETAVNGAGYLAARKSDVASVFRVVGDLSARLPDDTWLERLTFRDGGLEIAGQSAESTKLIALLQDSRVLSNPAFMGQISPDARTQKERFTLSARYQLRPGADQPPEPAAAAPAEADAAPADVDKEAADADASTAG
jgi:general secretion pathway protein L